MIILIDPVRELRQQLRDMGYRLHEDVLERPDFRERLEQQVIETTIETARIIDKVMEINHEV